MFYYGSWGTMCVPSNDYRHTPENAMNNARVICRMLGYPDALDSHCCGYYGPGVGGVYIGLAACSGKESHLQLCQSWDGYGMGCNHFQDFGVTCQKNRKPPELFLFMVSSSWQTTSWHLISCKYSTSVPKCLTT